MKKVLSILAVLTGAAYLVSGVSLLAFQNVVKAAMGYSAEYGMDLGNVYPLQSIAALVLMGIPCVVLGVLSMPESSFCSVGTNMLLVVYSGTMLALGGLLTNAANFINNLIADKTLGVQGLVSMSIVGASFGWIQFLVNLSLVILLLRGAFGLSDSTWYKMKKSS